jgi:BTB/POZ domain-containing protein 3/6
VLPKLSAQCNDFLAKNLHLESVCTILEQSIFYYEPELTHKCLHFMAPVVKDVFATDEFLTMSQPALKALARNDLLFCESEVIVYDACLRWAEAQCQSKCLECSEENLRAVLGDVIYHIRFPTMQDVEFARVVGKSNILTANEKSDIYYYLLTRDGTSIQFDCKPRVTICSRFSMLGTAQQWWSCNGPTDAFSFQADKDLDVIGLTVYGAKEKATHTVSIEVRDSAEHVLAKTGAVTVESDGSPSPIPIYLPSSAVINAGQTYTVMVTMRGALTHYGSGGQEVVAGSGVTLKFFTSSKSTNGTNTKSGQIPHLVFLPRTPGRGSGREKSSPNPDRHSTPQRDNSSHQKTANSPK